MAIKGINVLLICLVAAVAIALVGLTVLPRTAGWQFLTVLSPSMTPALDVGGLVAAQPVDPGAVAVGDIVVYRAPRHRDALVTHRVVEVVTEAGKVTGVRTRGDANNVADSYVVPAPDVVGRVTFHLPLVGYVLTFVRTPMGLLATLVVPGLALVALEARGLARHRAGGRKGSPARQ